MQESDLKTMSSKLLVVGLLSGIAGAFVSWMILHESKSDQPKELTAPPSGSPQSQSNALLPVLKDLAEELRELRKVVGNRDQVADPKGIRSVPFRRSETNGIEKLLRSLLESRNKREAAPVGLRDPTLLPTAEERAQAYGRISKEETRTDFKKRHLFMTYREVTSRYGLPYHINPASDGVVEWTYKLSDDAWFYLKFFEGVVIETSRHNLK